MNINFERGHSSSLDGVRGTAILLVLCFHCLLLPTFPLSFISRIGWVGVDLFFVLSGFLITGILLDSKGKKNYLMNFFAKRALRIMPLYYLSLGLFYLALKIPHLTSINPAFDVRHLDSSTYFLTFTQNLYFAYNGWGVTDILNHFWSLAIEEQFYLFWPFLIYFFDTKRILLVALFFILLSIVIRNFNTTSDYSYVFTLARIDALSIGSILAVSIRHHRKLLNRTTLPTFIVSLSILIFILFQTQDFHFRNPYLVRFGYTLFAILFACIIAFVYDTTKMGTVTNRVLSLGPLVFFGKYSYGIYVYHWLLYKGAYLYLQAKYRLPDISIIPFLIIVISVSVISYHCFEKHFLMFKSKFDSGKNREQ